jgi:hypothetical protein
VPNGYSDPDLDQRIQEFVTKYENSDPTWFNLFADNCTMLTIGATEPFKGRAAYEDNFKYLLRERRRVEELGRDVQVIGDTAVVLQLQDITQSGVSTTLSQSTIWRREGRDWKVIHMHCASIGTPRLTELPRDAGMIKVLASRIATVSAQNGCAQ